MDLTKDEFASMEKEQIVTTMEDEQSSVRVYQCLDQNQYQFAAVLDFQGSQFIWGCDNFEKARLAAGVMESGMPTSGSDFSDYGQHESPLGIAAAGRQVLAGYLKLLYDDSEHIQRNGGTRYCVAQVLGIEEDTVSSYWSRVRWNGCTGCGNETTREKVLIVDGDEVVIMECGTCGGYQVVPEDYEHQKHERPPEKYNIAHDNCGLEPVVVKHHGDEFKLWCCGGCGFYTAQPKRHKDSQ